MNIIEMEAIIQHIKNTKFAGSPADNFIIGYFNILKVNGDIKDLSKEINLPVPIIRRELKTLKKAGIIFPSLRNSKIKRREGPKCLNIGCNNIASRRHITKNGSISWHCLCSTCSNKKLEDKYFIDRNIIKIKKQYCENIDSRFGFKCTTTILHPTDLHLDHIDGNIYNTSVENIQTICSICHGFKTRKNNDTNGQKHQK